MEIIESNTSDVVISMYCTIPTKCSVTDTSRPKKKPAFKICTIVINQAYTMFAKNWVLSTA